MAKRQKSIEQESAKRERRRESQPPPLRTYTRKGVEYGVVYVDGSRRSLGRMDDPQTHREHARFCLEWTAEESGSPGLPHLPSTPAPVSTVADLVESWSTERQGRLRSRADRSPRTPYALKPLLDLFGPLPLEQFTVRHLKHVRKAMIDSGRLATDEINARIAVLKRVFKHGASEGLFDKSEAWLIAELDGLEPGDYGLHGFKQREEAPPAIVEPVIPFLPPPHDSIVRLLQLTGARPSELLTLTAGELDRNAHPNAWIAVPERHKMSHKGQKRVLVFTEEAQRILLPLFPRKPGLPLFRPVEGAAMIRKRRREGRETPLWDAHSARYRREQGRRTPKQHAETYDARTLGRAVTRAIDRCNREREEQGLDPVPRWSPYMLRHYVATDVADLLSSEDAALVLGHRTARDQRNRTTAGYVHRLVERTVAAFLRWEDAKRRAA